MEEEQNQKKKTPRKTRKHNKSIPGFGFVYQRGSDGRYVADFMVQETGKRKQKYAKTEKEAYALLQQAWREQQQGTLATGPNQKLKDYLEQWFEEVSRPTLRIGTYINRRKLLDTHIIPGLGHIPIQKLTPQKLQAFYTDKLNAGLSPSVIENMHGILKPALDNAVRWRLVSYNVSNDVTLPKAGKKKQTPVLTPEQAVQLLQAAKGHYLEIPIILALTTGMRHGEITGLRWDDINFDEGYLYVRHTVCYRSAPKGSQLKSQFIEGEPKTDAGNRKIILTQFAITKLKEHHAKQLEKRLQAGSTWIDHNLVCPNSRGGYMYDTYNRKVFHQLLQRTGLPRMRIHDLRHSTATLLLSLGIHPKVVQEMLGHSTISMTLDRYSHVLPSLQKEAAEKLNQLFEGQS